MRSDTVGNSTGKVLTLASAEELGGSLLGTDEVCLYEEDPLGHKTVDCEGFDSPRDAMP